VVVLQHGHGAEVVPVRVGAAYKNAVFLDHAEPWGRLARAGQCARPAMRAEGLNEG
jgi:hypothetical protein